MSRISRIAYTKWLADKMGCGATLMDIDWQKLFVAQTSLVELFLRGTVMYLALLVTLRILVRHHVGSMSLMDLLESS